MLYKLKEDSKNKTEKMSSWKSFWLKKTPRETNIKDSKTDTFLFKMTANRSQRIT